MKSMRSLARVIGFLFAVASWTQGRAEGGRFTDCNANAIPDAEEIAEGASRDCDQDGVPDECEVGFPAAVRRTAAGDDPIALVSADLDSDGVVDLVTGNTGSSDISVLLGNGDGTFQQEVHSAVGAGGRYVAWPGDLDGDGVVDFATVSNEPVSHISVFRGNGDGTFEPVGDLAAGTFSVALVATDFNGDGQIDLASANSGSEDISTLPGRGDGTFQAQRRFAVGDRPAAIVAADLDSDGQVNLGVLKNRGVSLMAGKGDGTFRVVQRVDEGGGGVIPGAIVAADLDSDGSLDLAVPDCDTGDISILPGNGDGTFQPRQDVAVDGHSSTLVAADVDGDSHVDLASVVDYWFVTVLLGNGDGTFRAEPRLAAGIGLGVDRVSTDLDGDSNLDLVIASGAGITALRRNGDGTIQSTEELVVGDNPVALVGADFDGDARLDLAVANYGSRDISVLLGNGDGTLQAEIRLPAFMARAGPTALAASDFDGDGLLDLAAANLASGDIIASGDVSVFLGNGDGTFHVLEERFPAAMEPAAIVAADFNTDGRTDLAVMNSFSRDVSVLLGSGNGTFQPQQRFGIAGYSTSLVAADLDGDRRADLFAGGCVLLNMFPADTTPPGSSARRG